MPMSDVAVPAAPGRSSSLSSAWRLVAGAPLLAASPALWAAEAAARVPAVHQLWVAHLLVGFIAALIGFVAARWWALAGIAVLAALAYALPQMAAPGVPPGAVEQFGARYPFHVQATALLVPLCLIAGVGAGRSFGRAFFDD